jgi:hypothetical protein
MTLLWTSSMPPWTGLKSFTTQLDFDFFVQFSILISLYYRDGTLRQVVLRNNFVIDYLNYSCTGDFSIPIASSVLVFYARALFRFITTRR